MRFRTLIVALFPFLSLACDHEHEHEHHHDGEPSGAVCPTDNALTYDNFAKDFFDTYCTRCHSSAVTGDLRLGAPLGMDFDTLAGIEQHLDHIDLVAAAGPSATNASMPESNPVPTLAERTSLGLWIACDAPLSPSRHA